MLSVRIALALIGFTGIAVAHPLTPPLLEIREAGNGRVDVTWKTGMLATPDAPLRPLLPPACRALAAPVSRQSATDASLVATWTIHCPNGIVGEQIGVTGLDAASSQALLRVFLADGRLLQHVLTIAVPALSIPLRPDPLALARSYLMLGVRRMLTAPEHVFFVLGLLLLAPGFRSFVWALGGYVIGYSITLALTVLGFAPTVSGPAELATALTVLALAVELSRRTLAPTLMRRFLWLVACAFGLVHGLAFAAVLRASAPAPAEIPLALGAFNLGLDLGGFACAGLALTAWLAFRRGGVSLPGWAPHIPAYAMGSLAVFWSLQRAAAMF